MRALVSRSGATRVLFATLCLALNFGLFFSEQVDEEDVSDKANDEAVNRSRPIRISLPSDCGRAPMFGFNRLANQSAHPLVAGGYTAKKGQFPSFVNVVLKRGFIGMFWCGGTIITDRHILTAGHCAEGAYGAAVSPTHDRKAKSDVYPVEKICILPQFSHQQVLTNDISILKLRDKIKFSDSVQPACLPNNDISHRTQAYAIGMGSLSSYRIAQTLQVLPVRRESCDLADYHRSKICFRSNNKRYVGDTCQGK